MRADGRLVIVTASEIKSYLGNPLVFCADRLLPKAKEVFDLSGLEPIGLDGKDEAVLSRIWIIGAVAGADEKELLRQAGESVAAFRCLPSAIRSIETKKMRKRSALVKERLSAIPDSPFGLDAGGSLLDAYQEGRKKRLVELGEAEDGARYAVEGLPRLGMWSEDAWSLDMLDFAKDTEKKRFLGMYVDSLLRIVKKREDDSGGAPIGVRMHCVSYSPYEIKDGAPEDFFGKSGRKPLAKYYRVESYSVSSGGARGILLGICARMNGRLDGQDCCPFEELAKNESHSKPIAGFEDLAEKLAKGDSWKYSECKRFITARDVLGMIANGDSGFEEAWRQMSERNRRMILFLGPKGSC